MRYCECKCCRWGGLLNGSGARQECPESTLTKSRLKIREYNKEIYGPREVEVELD